MIGDIQINDHVFHPNGYRKLTEGFIDFEVSARTINNTLVSDFFDTKRTYSISWDGASITGELLDEFIALYKSTDDVTFIKTNYDLTTTTVICRLRLSGNFLRDYEQGTYSYNGITIELEEV